MSKITGYILAVLYPAAVFLSVSVFHFPVRLVGFVIIVLAASLLLLKKGKVPVAPLIMGIVAFTVILTDSEIVLRFYPVAVNLVFLFTFGMSLRHDETVIFTFACLGDKSIKWNGNIKTVQRYCRRVTCVWCVFFVVNGSIAAFTVFQQSTGIWALYNGLVSYILIGCLFAAEFIVRGRMQKRISRGFSLSSMSVNSRDKDAIVCYSGKFSQGDFKLWKDYLNETAALRKFISSKDIEKVILHSDDFWYFIVGLTAVLQCGKEAYVSSNYSFEFIKPLIDSKTLCLSADKFSYSECIPEIIGDVNDITDVSLPPVPEDSRVYLFTSGSTGEPKGVLHEIRELEWDNDSIGDKWRGDFQKRLLVSSVNPHHAFGIVFAAIKPFVYGVPFRREKISQPDDFLHLGNEKYAFITTPSFLKMSVKDPAIGESMKIIRDISIVTAGGVLRRNEALEVNRAYGSHPLEIYGSTETGAVGWRINKDDESEWWTPTKDVVVESGDDGCLVFYCSAIHGGIFHSSDLADLREDGKFKLIGRKDSVVKIAEKRVSLIEVENRIIQTGLAKDTVVFAMSSEKRQYLAAVVVLSKKGEELLGAENHAGRMKVFRSRLFEYLEPVTIPKRWRFVQEIPYNSMGKLQKQEVLALFDKEIEDGR